MRLTTLVLAPVGLLLAAVPFTPRAPQPAAPDLILHHGRIITVDAQDRVAQAIAIRGNRIMAVGTDAEVLRLAGAGTRRIDLGGRAVTPGLLDAHAHFSGGATDRYFLLDVGYPAVKSIADIVAAVRARAAARPAGSFIEGAGWDEGSSPSAA
ncbi:MAG: amidohydrolase family protein [Gemmatimonadetes bacterium]|nr:amidohydrolase family protein [Gemmatimonadota bacterium]